MNKIYIILILSSLINASTYIAKVEPYNSYKIKTQVAGVVTFSNKQKEFTYIEEYTKIITINTKEEQISLQSLKDSLSIQNEILKIHQKNFKKKLKVKHISEYEKSQEKLLLLNSKQFISKLEISIAILKKHMSDKKFYANNIYLNEIFIEKNEYAEVGELLYELYDFSKLKLVIFVKADEIKQLREKNLFVDNIQNDFKIEKISQVRDTKRVSTHKVVLSKVNLNNNNIYFGQIVKVEFK
ncbi:MAG: hypothetical protein HRT43_04975 [Campylobacteraceae bacterium]|nr:hypothetical protein [Campylobacteraceae bacterium]